jgi:hypothetical protein
VMSKLDEACEILGCMCSSGLFIKWAYASSEADDMQWSSTWMVIPCRTRPRIDSAQGVLASRPDRFIGTVKSDAATCLLYSRWQEFSNT